ncbi:Thioredoxin-like protein [Apiospora arundinis]
MSSTDLSGSGQLDPEAEKSHCTARPQLERQIPALRDEDEYAKLREGATQSLHEMLFLEKAPIGLNVSWYHWRINKMTFHRALPNSKFPYDDAEPKHPYHSPFSGEWELTWKHHHLDDVHGAKGSWDHRKPGLVVDSAWVIPQPELPAEKRAVENPFFKRREMRKSRPSSRHEELPLKVDDSLPIYPNFAIPKERLAQMENPFFKRPKTPKMTAPAARSIDRQSLRGIDKKTSTYDVYYILDLEKRVDLWVRLLQNLPTYRGCECWALPLPARFDRFEFVLLGYEGVCESLDDRFVRLVPRAHRENNGRVTAHDLVLTPFRADMNLQNVNLHRALIEGWWKLARWVARLMNGDTVPLAQHLKEEAVQQIKVAQAPGPVAEDFTDMVKKFGDWVIDQDENLETEQLD